MSVCIPCCWCIIAGTGLTAADSPLWCLAGACKYEAHDEPSEVEDVNKKWEEMKAKWASLSEHEKARCALAP